MGINTVLQHQHDSVAGTGRVADGSRTPAEMVRVDQHGVVHARRRRFPLALTSGGAFVFTTVGIELVSQKDGVVDDGCGIKCCPCFQLCLVLSFPPTSFSSRHEIVPQMAPRIVYFEWPDWLARIVSETFRNCCEMLRRIGPKIDHPPALERNHINSRLFADWPALSTIRTSIYASACIISRFWRLLSQMAGQSITHSVKRSRSQFVGWNEQTWAS
jgi:hypothetical protein